MPVKDFIPIQDARLTIEKEVKPKLTTKELTTIEKPGIPVPALQLMPQKKKARVKIQKPKKEPSSIMEPKADSILIITEKPQAAEKIANAIGHPIRRVENRVSYYELNRGSEKIMVASAVGHLFNLTYIKGQKGWPVFNIEWTPSFLSKRAEFTKSYHDVLKKLSKKAKEIIVATDYDIEGEVIGWNVVRFICGKDSAKRMKYSTLTKDELVRSYENPMPELDWGQAYAGETRHILDWLYGINLSRALMSSIKNQGSFKILSIGRVQGPALKIIVDKEREIDNFKSVPFWEVSAFVNSKEGGTLVPREYKHPKDIFNEKELEKFKDIKEADAETKKTEEYLPPPHPFDLTTLQREAYRLHNISPSQTLTAAQKLYLDSLISYPRTSSQKIPPSIEPKKILKELERKKHESTMKINAIERQETLLEGKTNKIREEITSALKKKKE